VGFAHALARVMISAMESDGEMELERDRLDGATVVRLRPLRVLIVSGDHRFRAVTAMLATRRGCTVLSLTGALRVGALLASARVDVALVDGLPLLHEVACEVGRVAPLATPLGVVLATEGEEPVPDGLVAVAKWSPFDGVYAAIVEADRRRARKRVDGALAGPPFAAIDGS
jgi:hypothetical protein